MLNYYIGDILFCSCRAGSFMDIAIRAMQKRDYEMKQKEISRRVLARLPIAIPIVKAHKDILRDVRVR